ncbi:MAG: glycerol-3-phosphate acyltransferase [Spirochaetales bacterium]|nr:glycerol-3-phosphate acyltransferase [Spirochaetales bacterium]
MNTIYFVVSILAVFLGYIIGSINFAIPITRLVLGKDIRTLGNHNPGTSNVLREVGVFWGILVGFLDGMKGLGPIIVLRLIYFNFGSSLDFLILYLVGFAAVLGHCKSIFMKFKGGGGVGTMLGVSLFFVPLEFLFSMLLGGELVLIFFRNAEFKFGQKTPIFFITLTPFVTLATALLFDIPLFAHISIGGHNWGTVAGAFVMSLGLLALNIAFLMSKEKKRAN